MEFNEAKGKFIQAWGALGTSWGINKAMAQIHALLLVSPKPLSAEDVMNELQISRGNVNMNIRALIDWGIVNKEHKIGERREYFSADKDIWQLARQVARERRRREIEPILKILHEVRDIPKNSDQNTEEFLAVTQGLRDFTEKADFALEKFAKGNKNWFMKVLMKL